MALIKIDKGRDIPTRTLCHSNLETCTAVSQQGSLYSSLSHHKEDKIIPLTFLNSQYHLTLPLPEIPKFSALFFWCT